MTPATEQPSQACVDCLRHAYLLAHLAPYIERVAAGAAGSPSTQLLRLSNEDLAAAVAPQAAARLLAQLAALADRRLRTSLEDSGCWACCRHDAAFPAGLRNAADAPWEVGVLEALPFSSSTNSGFVGQITSNSGGTAAAEVQAICLK